MFGIKALRERVAKVEAEHDQLVETVRLFCDSLAVCRVCGQLGFAPRMVDLSKTGSASAYDALLRTWAERPETLDDWHVHNHCIAGSAYDRREKPRKGKKGRKTDGKS